MKKIRKKRLLRVLVASLALVPCLLFLNVTAYAESYYPDTFTFLEHKNIYSALTFGSSNVFWNGSGWFRAVDTSFDGEPFRMVQYNVGGFQELGPDSELGTPARVTAALGINSDLISVPAGGVLDLKFDWYYNIKVDMLVYCSAADQTKWVRQVPITGMDSSLTEILLRGGSSDPYNWYKVTPTITDHGIVSGDFWSGDALYRSTVHLIFKNTTDQDLQIRQIDCVWDPQKVFYNPAMKDWIVANNSGIVPARSDIGEIRPVSTSYSNWISMGYSSNSLPSYKVVQPEDVEQYELINAIGDPSGHDYDDFEKFNDDVNDQMKDTEAKEDEVVGDMTDRMDEVSGEILDYDNVNDSIVQLSSGFSLISSSFSELIDQGTPGTFRSVLIYAICGGVLLTVVGQVPGIVNGVTERVARNREEARARAEEEKRGIWKNRPKGNPAEWHGTKVQAKNEINKFLDD